MATKLIQRTPRALKSGATQTLPLQTIRESLRVEADMRTLCEDHPFYNLHNFFG